MTIVGTYFFYTQLSVFLLKMFKKNKRFYWNHTRLITISDLAYRMKDNARMFFMVTIVSTVAFCAIGTLSAMGGSKNYSTNVLKFPLSINHRIKTRAKKHRYKPFEMILIKTTYRIMKSK